MAQSTYITRTAHKQMRASSCSNCSRSPISFHLPGTDSTKTLKQQHPSDLYSPERTALGGVESSALESLPEPESLSLPERHGTRMLITGEPGSRWTIQRRDGGSKWKTIGVINNSPFEAEFLDHSPNRDRHRIYRVLTEYPQRINTNPILNR